MEFSPIGFQQLPSQAAFGHLSVEALSVQIDGRSVLDEISLEVAQGEIVGLLGRDGAGKSTCFEAIAGLVSAKRGHVRLKGVEVTDWSLDRRARLGLAYLPEAVSIFRGLTAEDNVLAALEISEPSSAIRSRRLEVLLADFELKSVRDQVATTLSGGERRRCELARAMALNPSILLLDEPFRGLDPTSVSSTRRAIASLRDQNIGVLVSDYDLHDLLELLDRVYVLHEGRLMFSGRADQLLSDPDVRNVYLGEKFSFSEAVLASCKRGQKPATERALSTQNGH